MDQEEPEPFSGNERLPVDRVSWFDAVAFCNELSRKEGSSRFSRSMASRSRSLTGTGQATACRPRRWEYACRAGTTTRFSFGDDENLLGEHAWYGQNSAAKPIRGEKKRTHSACSTCTATSGVVLDWFDASYYNDTSSHVDPQGPKTGAGRVLRGGSWNNFAFNLSAPPTTAGTRRLCAAGTTGFAWPGLITGHFYTFTTAPRFKRALLESDKQGETSLAIFGLC